MSIGEFAVQTDITTGLGSLERLPAIVEALGMRRVAVAVDSALIDNGLLAMILGHAPNLEPVAILGFPPNPDVAPVESAAAEARAADADSLIVIGGGSALGGGKATAIRLTNDRPITTYEGVNRVPNRPAPVIAIPTTAGSGSEVSNALVLHEDGRHTELVVRGRGCEPRAAILDGRVLRGLPAKPMLYAGLDALTHCMEAMWARAATYFTTALALRSAERIADLLPLAVAGAASGANESGANDAVLHELLEASSAANMACGNSGLGLVHALSSSPDVKLAHGLQNGVLLPHVAAFNADALPPEGRSMLARIDALYSELSFDPAFPSVADFVVEAERMVEASQGHPFRANNRRASTDEELAALLVAAGAVA